MVGRYGDGLKLRVAAPATGNRANDAVVELVAKEFNLDRADVSVISGASSRHKRVRLIGVDVADAGASWIGCSPMCGDDAMTRERGWRCPPSWKVDIDGRRLSELTRFADGSARSRCQ